MRGTTDDTGDRMTGTVATATIETLTAEVRVLMVGSRQITLSVFRQLDTVRRSEMRPFGRVNDGPTHEKVKDEWGYWRTGSPRVWLVGADTDSGQLVRCLLTMPALPDEPGCSKFPAPYDCASKGSDEWHSKKHAAYDKAMDAWTTARRVLVEAHALPLIVMAGLR